MTLHKTQSEIANSLASMRQRVSDTLKAGMLTNMGTFTHWDEQGAAHFVSPLGRKGWTGRDALHLIQIVEK